MYINYWNNSFEEKRGDLKLILTWGTLSTHVFGYEFRSHLQIIIDPEHSSKDIATLHTYLLSSSKHREQTSSHNQSTIHKLCNKFNGHFE